MFPKEDTAYARWANWGRNIMSYYQESYGASVQSFAVNASLRDDFLEGIRCNPDGPDLDISTVPDTDGMRMVYKLCGLTITFTSKLPPGKELVVVANSRDK